jgi:enoyl-CoA hydratase
MPAFSLEKDGHVTTLWLDNADRRNAMGPDFFADLPRVVAEVDADPEVRAVVLAAKGPHFSTGLDLMKMAGDLGPALLDGGLAKERYDLFRKIAEMRKGFDAIGASNKPFVAAIHGLCIGGGLDLVAACDVRVAAASAKLGIRETKIAIVADMGSLQRLEKIVGRGHLRELALTGRDIDAERALRIGLVNDVLPDEAAALAAARSIAREIAANAPLVVQGTKEVLRYSGRVGEDAGLEYAALWNAAHLASHDLREAMGAFVEKRKPTFSGK